MPHYRRPPMKKPASRIGVVLIYLLLSSVILLSLLNVLGRFGEIIQNICFGIFGLSAYALTIMTIIVCIRKLINNRIMIDRRKALKFLPLIVIGILILHIISTKDIILHNYGSYLKQCYAYGYKNAGGIVFGTVAYLFLSVLDYHFSLSILVIAFFTVAFLSLYPLFLNTGNFKTRSVRYRSRKNTAFEGEERSPDNIQVGNELFIGSPDGKTLNNKIIRKSAFSSNKTRDFDILFPNKQDMDTETVEENTLIEKIKNKSSYDILFTNPYDKTEEAAPVKPNKNNDTINAPQSLIFPAVIKSEKDEIRKVKGAKPKPVVSADDKYANYTLGYKQAQIKKSLEEGVEIKSYATKKRLGIFDDADSEKTLDNIEKNKHTKTPEEQERFERAKKRLYGNEDEQPQKEQDRTFESLFINNRTPDLHGKTIFKKEEASEKKSSYDILYGNKTDEYNLPEYNLDKNIYRKDITREDSEENTAIKKSVEPMDILNEFPSKAFDVKKEDDSWQGYEFNQKTDILSELPSEAPIRALRSDIGKSHNTFPRKINNDIMDVKVDAKQVSLVDSPTAVYKKTQYIAPPEDLLKMYPRVESDSIDEHKERCIALRNVLMEYGIDTVVDRYTVGPSFTRYEITMPIGVTVKRIQQISDDIAMRLKANKLRIEAPIPGKNAVGVEIANNKPSIVGLREGIRSAAFKKEAELSFILGVNLSGEVHTCNIVRMPHLLIAGATGSGKSVCINALICSLMYKYSPDQVRLILIDPKRVELSHYTGLPHLLIPEIIYDAEIAMNAMNWATGEMERRYELFHNMRVRNLDEHNKKAEEDGMPTLPYIVIIIDELADLMTYKKRDIEDRIKRLAQLARAAGIHLIFATQRPSVDIITGTIKANFPSRVAFAVTSFNDSKTILDHGGADKLRGQGDMLYVPSGSPDPIRLQGAFITNEEVEAITDFVRENNPSFYEESIEAEINAVKPLKEDTDEFDEAGETSDEIFLPALKMIIENEQASISMIQRRFAVGYARAARIIDEMELRGYIGPNEGSKPREVKISQEEFEALFGGDIE